MKNSNEILINAIQITNEEFSDSFEFVINDKLRIVDCVKIDALDIGDVTPITNPAADLEGMLFELNHVRVNPHIDNTKIIGCLTEALSDIGVAIENQPSYESMAMCFKPLGEISHNVRFYVINNNQIVLLSSATKPKLAAYNGKHA